MNARLISAFMSILLVFGCTNTSEQKAKRVIRDYMKTHKSTLSYRKSFQFSRLDSTFNRDAEYDRLRALRKRYWDTALIDITKPRFSDREKIYRKKVDSIKSLINALKDAKRHTGYKMRHDYFDTSSSGGLYRNVFYFDTVMNIVKVYGWRDDPDMGYPSERRYYSIDSIGTEFGER